jgi:hypothetical protein|nr:MAG TPA: Protein of unknown function (DUF1492) [Caudoviricetes sp.]
MTPKKYLEQIQILETKINLKKDQILEERARAQSCTAVMFERVQTSPREDSLPNIINRICEFEKDMDNLIDELIDLKRDIIAKLDQMTNSDHIRILDMKYLKGKNLVEVACELNYSYRQVKRKHGWALEEFKQFM